MVSEESTTAAEEKSGLKMSLRGQRCSSRADLQQILYRVEICIAFLALGILSRLYSAQVIIEIYVSSECLSNLECESASGFIKPSFPVGKESGDSTIVSIVLHLKLSVSF